MEPITREEQYLSSIAGEETATPIPITRVEHYLAKMAGQDVGIPAAPITRIEQYLEKIIENGGGGSSVTVEELNVTENGTYTAEEGTAYSPVNVDVPELAKVKQTATSIADATTTMSFDCSFQPAIVCAVGVGSSPHTGDSKYICAVYGRYLNTQYPEISFIKCDGSSVFRGNAGLISWADGTLTFNNPSDYGYTDVKYESKNWLFCATDKLNA